MKAWYGRMAKPRLVQGIAFFFWGRGEGEVLIYFFSVLGGKGGGRKKTLSILSFFFLSISFHDNNRQQHHNPLFSSIFKTPFLRTPENRETEMSLRISLLF